AQRRQFQTVFPRRRDRVRRGRPAVLETQGPSSQAQTLPCSGLGPKHGSFILPLLQIFMGAQPGSRLVQLSTPRQKEFALRRENINECFFEFTIEPGKVVLFSHVDSSVSRAGILLQAKSQVGTHHDLFIPRSTENVARCATCNPTSSRSCLSFSPTNARSSSGYNARVVVVTCLGPTPVTNAALCGAWAKSRGYLLRSRSRAKPRRFAIDAANGLQH